MIDYFPFKELCEQLSFTDVLDNIDAGIIIYGKNGDFLFMNTVMVNWRNIPRAEYLKMNVHDFTSVLDVCIFDLVCEKKERVSRLQYYKNFQEVNSPTHIRIVTGTPIFNEQGEIHYVICMLQDIDEFEQRHHALLEQHKVLAGINEIGRPAIENRLIARSPELKQLLSVTDNVAPIDSNILLYGESGSGKEVFARYIHNHSARKDKPLITVNCAAFPENLIEAELFGYEKGSFTGANRDGKPGLAEASNGGTLFLDEINSLPLNMQGKVLRMIEDKSVQRIGAIRAKKIDFRLIAATNRNLGEMVKEGTFREDLYYRLNVIPLTIPPLRNRRADIVPLCLHFLHDYCQKYDLRKDFSDGVLAQIQLYNWPGNVRELRNFVERMVVMTPNNVLKISSIPNGILAESQQPMPSGGAPAVYENRRRKTSGSKLTRESLLEALGICQNNREKTAAYLGISRRQLQYKIKEFHISDRCRYQEGAAKEGTE